MFNLHFSLKSFQTCCPDLPILQEAPLGIGDGQPGPSKHLDALAETVCFKAGVLGQEVTEVISIIGSKVRLVMGRGGCAWPAGPTARPGENRNVSLHSFAFNVFNVFS